MTHRRLVKLKADYLDSFGDSVDVVIVGAKFGKGQRKDCYGSFLCAVREENGVHSFAMRHA